MKKKVLKETQPADGCNGYLCKAQFPPGFQLFQVGMSFFNKK